MVTPRPSQESILFPHPPVAKKEFICDTEVLSPTGDKRLLEELSVFPLQGPGSKGLGAGTLFYPQKVPAHGVVPSKELGVGL